MTRFHITNTCLTVVDYTYEVEAETEDAALENWREGNCKFMGADIGDVIEDVETIVDPITPEVTP
jgi:hypothetical protein